MGIEKIELLLVIKCLTVELGVIDKPSVQGRNSNG